MAQINFGNNTGHFQPIIRGIQNVGSVEILYRYNFFDQNSQTFRLPLPSNEAMRVSLLQGKEDAQENSINCGVNGIPVAGFRLDSEFLRANPQIASSFVIPILGGGGVALTNNNRTGTLNLVCTKVAAPDVNAGEGNAQLASMLKSASTIQIEDPENPGALKTLNTDTGIGVKSDEPYWDFVTLAQIQQAADGGDSCGATIKIVFMFCGVRTTVIFEGCTIATVDPLGLAGNDAVNYNVVVNYLNWTLSYVD